MNLIILANSVMHGQSCIAGKELITNTWVRLKGGNLSGITDSEQCLNNPNLCILSCPCHNFKKPKLLDIINVNTVGLLPPVLAHQTENHQITPITPWQYINKLSIQNIASYLDNPSDIWGSDDKISIENLPNNSLYFLEVEVIYLYRNNFNRRRARIEYNGIFYDLGATAKEFDNLHAKYGSGNFSAYVTISLGEIFKGHAYKLVAGIIEK
ncbi:hypothetical protein [Cetobacterium sp. ZOR0034]|uniref:dual OB domain-containing protein n=1 Tax=Cetobacterium sp. ZOR0034 TaxID=1339239 RepID=UPI00064897F6|nr:hypothetical protein [Cetobacterium sp. ZOR0034]